MWQGMGGEEKEEQRLQASKRGQERSLQRRATEMPSEEGYGASVVWRVGTFSRRNFTTRCCSHQKMGSLCTDSGRVQNKSHEKSRLKNST